MVKSAISSNKNREIRCQGAVIKDGFILLVKHINHRSGHEYWWLPGGGLETGETEEECVAREIREETELTVQIDRLLFHSTDPNRLYTYHAYATFLCTPLAGQAVPGTEHESSHIHSILNIGWYPLWDETSWEPDFYEAHLYPFLSAIQTALKKDF